ncbi:GtrA family protein [Agathobacter sp.]|uniref:GtrA family protein n=1 Tax=Agathobacter sp. TaxID=2021311 RepID=UPI003AB6D5E3
MSSLSSFVLDYFLFSIFVFLFPEGTLPVLIANIAAQMVSAFYNYSLNCRFVFYTNRQFRTVADYFTLASGI